MIALFLSSWASAAEPVALDASSLISPVLTDFDRLHLEGSDDTRASWTQPPKRVSWQGAPDPLAGDHILGGVLHLDLEPGRWTGWILVGAESEPRIGWGHQAFRVLANDVAVIDVPTADADTYLASDRYALAPFPVFREGENEWDRQVSLRHPWHPFSVDIGKDGVDLQVEGRGLQALVLVPERDAPAGSLAVDLANLHRRAWYVEHVVPGADDTPPPPPMPEAGVQVALWKTPPDANRATTTPSWHRDAAPGERLSAVFWLFDDAPVSWTVDLDTDWRSDTFELHWLDASNILGRPRRPRPSVLRPTSEALRGGQGMPTGLGLVMHVADDAPPGVHRGEVTLNQGDQSWTVPLRVDVHPVTLDPPDVPFGLAYDARPEVAHWHGDLSDEHRRVIAADIALMRDFGADLVGLRYALPSSKRWASTPEQTEVFTAFMELWRGAGGGPVLWFDPYFALDQPAFRTLDGPPLPDDRASDFAVMGEAAAAWDDVYLHVIDEGGGRNLANPSRAIEVIDALREIVPRPRLSAAIPHPVDWVLAEPLDLVLRHRNPGGGPELTHHLQDGDALVWSYNIMPGRPFTGLASWGMDVDGALMWHWNDSHGDPFDDTQKRTQHQRSLLAPNGEVWPTPLLASFADGIDDWRYLQTLERWVEAAEACGSRRVRAQATSGRQLLDIARGATHHSLLVGPHDRSAWSEEALQDLRDATRAELETLQGLQARCLRR